MILITAIILFMLGIVALVFPAIYFCIHEPAAYFYRRYIYFYKSALPDADKQYLASVCTFYSKLDADNRKRFEMRVSFIIRFKKFKGIGMEVTHNMQLLIAAGMAEVTFGLTHFREAMFKTINIYNESYAVGDTGLLAKGHVSQDGYINLVWHYVEEGFKDSRDGINLAIHEMAHAEVLTAIKEGDDMGFAVRYDDWQVVAKPELVNLRNGNNTFFRAYGASTIDEFFSITVENFFERADEFKQQMPHLYAATCTLLRLDATQAANPIIHGDRTITAADVQNDINKPAPAIQSEIKASFPVKAQPRLSVGDIYKLALANTRNIVFFIGGILSWAATAYCIWGAVYLSASVTWELTAAATAFTGIILFAQVFSGSGSGNSNVDPFD